MDRGGHPVPGSTPVRPRPAVTAGRTDIRPETRETDRACRSCAHVRLVRARARRCRRIPCRSLTDGVACPEHEAAHRACVATRAAVARAEQRFRLRTPTSRSALGLPGWFAIPMPAMRARLPDRRVHRGHVAPAGCDGVRGVRRGAAAVNPLYRARRYGTDAVLGERPRLASGPPLSPERPDRVSATPIDPLLAAAQRTPARNAHTATET